MITREQMMEIANMFCDCTMCPQYGYYCAYVCEINKFIHSLPNEVLEENLLSLGVEWIKSDDAVYKREPLLRFITICVFKDKFIQLNESYGYRGRYFEIEETQYDDELFKWLVEMLKLIYDGNYSYDSLKILASPSAIKDLNFTNEYLNIPVNESKLISYLRIYHGGY